HFPLRKKIHVLTRGHFVSANEHFFQKERRRLFQMERKTAKTNPFSNGVRPSFLVSAFYVTWDDASFTSLQQNIQHIDRLYPQWINLSSGRGDLQSLADLKAVEFLKKEHPDLPVLPMVTNFNFKKELWM